MEAHGTGTAFGDPVEMAALAKAYKECGWKGPTDAKQWCGIGSLKTNLGHLDVVAGVAGLIKVVLSLQHATIPASLHFSAPNPHINFSQSPFFVNSSCTRWELPNSLSVRRAGVSSFGFGGTNAHAILEEAPQRNTCGATSSLFKQNIVILSAKTPTALETVTKRLLVHLTIHKDSFSFDDLAYTLQVGRERFTQRQAIVCKSVDELVDKIQHQQFVRSVVPDEIPTVSIISNNYL